MNNLSIVGPISELTLALCSRPARDHFRATTEGFERANCAECAAIGRVISGNRAVRTEPPAVAAVPRSQVPVQIQVQRR